jgi:NACalpha-BTF3-like transcription factor
MSKQKIFQVTVNKEDIELIVAEMELSKERADRCLREHDGDVVAALTSLVNS